MIWSRTRLIFRSGHPGSRPSITAISLDSGRSRWQFGSMSDAICASSVAFSFRSDKSQTRFVVRAHLTAVAKVLGDAEGSIYTSSHAFFNPHELAFGLENRPAGVAHSQPGVVALIMGKAHELSGSHTLYSIFTSGSPVQ